MLSIDFVKANKQKVIDAASNKKRIVDVDKILHLDEKRREHVQKAQRLREERNNISKQKPDPSTIQRGKALKDELKQLESILSTIELELNQLLLHLPNVPLEEVPIGDATQNKELKKWGEAPQFSFEPRSHIELGKALDIVDLERGAKVSGFRGYFLKNQGAMLHFALLMYVFTKMVKKGYVPIIAPTIVKEFTLIGSGQFPWGKEEVYKLNDEDAYLAGTAEVPVTALHAGEFIPEAELPKKYVAFSSCFRKEAGAYGKDTKGLYRVHEFWKVEQVIITKNDLSESIRLHEELQQNTEEIFQELGIPYRVLLMATGDMGEPQIKKYDTEVWMPSRNSYGEAASNSLLGDFQARRLKIKLRRKDGSTNYCFTLNNTAIASPRILIAILENYQREDGSVLIPKALQPLTGFDAISNNS